MLRHTNTAMETWFACLCLVASGLVVRAAEAEAPEIPVVETWGKLLSLGPVVAEPLNAWRQRQDLRTVKQRPGGEPVRLQARIGISCRRLRVGEVGIAYCHIKGWDGSSKGTGDPFGPFGIEVLPRGVKAMRCLRQSACVKVLGEDKRGALHARAFGFARPGEYMVRVYDPKLNVVAQARVRCLAESAGKKPVALWYPWGDSALADGHRSEVEDTLELRVEMPAGPPAVPKLEVMPVPPTVVGAPDAPLPHVELATPDPALKLQRDADGNLVLKSTAGLVAGNITDCILSSWWVNGRPALVRVQRPDRLVPERLYQSVAVKTIVLRLGFDAAAVGANPGDEVGVQLLYCPFGWQPTDDSLQERMLHEIGVLADQPMMPRLTNRITWCVE